MTKSAQNVIGSVMCCPGCFSLYRASAVRNILPYYAVPTEQSFDVFVKDTGIHFCDQICGLNVLLNSF